MTIRVCVIGTPKDFTKKLSQQLAHNNIQILTYIPHLNKDDLLKYGKKVSIFIIDAEKMLTGYEYDAITDILNVLPDKKIIAMTKKYSLAVFSMVKFAGTKGYFHRTAGLTSMVNCIRKVYEGGESFLPPTHHVKTLFCPIF